MFSQKNIQRELLTTALNNGQTSLSPEEFSAFLLALRETQISILDNNNNKNNDKDDNNAAAPSPTSQPPNTEFSLILLAKVKPILKDHPDLLTDLHIFDPTLSSES